MRVLNDKEAAVGVTASNFEKKRGAETQGVGLAKAVLASADDVKSARGGRCCGLRFHLTCEDFLKTRSGHDRRNSSEKRTSLHGAPLLSGTILFGPSAPTRMFEVSQLRGKRIVDEMMGPNECRALIVTGR
jgi:hypothetical protein